MQVKQYASPHITLQEWQSGAKTDIDIFEDQVGYWVFAQADVLSSSANPNRIHSGQAVLSLVTPYFEMVSAYVKGRASKPGETTKFLRDGITTVFGSQVSAKAVDRYVSEVRNGLFHELIFRTVLLHDGKSTTFPSFGIVSTSTMGGSPPFDLLCVNPFWVLDEAKKHFAGFLSQVRSPRTDADRALAASFQAFITVRKARTT